MSSEVGRRLIAESKQQLVEGGKRLKQCLGQLSDKEIWFRPNEQSNAVGNLVLHLCGNVRQYIIAGLGGAPDARERAREFAERGPIPAAALVAKLEETLAGVAAALDGFDPADLMTDRVIQGKMQNPVAVLMHVTEHFSYHVGQVTYFLKAGKAVDTAYYRGWNLNAKNQA